MFSPFNLIPDIPPDIYKSHLNILTNNDDQTKPLWSTNFGGHISSTSNSQQEYFEIGILTDKTEDIDLPSEKNMGEILNMNKYLCHICNIEVPKTYTKEHNNSMKHKTCNAIANLALERIKLQMQLDFACSRKIEISETYFCDPCAAVVLIADKEKHEKTKTHKISLKHDQLLADLFRIYSDIDNVEVKSEIDDLELLQQMIELESVPEESQNTGTDSFANIELETIDLKAMQEEVINVLTNELKSALDFKTLSALNFHLSSVVSEMSEMRDLTKRMNNQTGELHDTLSTVFEYEKIRLGNVNKHIGDLDNQSVAPKLSRNARKKAYKRNEIQKKIERFNRYATGIEIDTKVSVNNRDFQKSLNDSSKVVIIKEITDDPLNEENNSSQLHVKKTGSDPSRAENDSSEEVVKEKSRNPGKVEENSLTAIEKEHDDLVQDSLEDEIKLSAVVKTEVRTFENTNCTIKQLTNKIDAIMSKYFDSSRTVDALNNIERDHNKNKEPNKNFENRNIIMEKHKSKSNKGSVKKNMEQIQNVEDKKQENDNMEHDETIEENNNKKNIEHNENKQNEEKNKEDIEQIENKQEQNIMKNKENNNNEENNKKKKVRDQNKKEPSTNLISTKRSVVSKPSKPQTPSFSLVYYLKDISRRCETRPIHTVEAVTDSIVQITAINGDKFRVLVNNFHSFHVKANDIYCKVCETPNVRRPEWHIAESEHRAKVMIPIKDLNGIRQLDDIWSHCILCNDLTKNVEFHLQLLLHKNKQKHCLVELGSNNSDDVIEVYEEKREINMNKGAVITALILKNNLAMTNKNYLNCVICDVIVNYDLASVQQHINSFYHLNNFERQQNENKLIDIDEERFYCIGCDVQISKIDSVSHCNGKKHKKLLLELLARHGEEMKMESDETEIILESISQSVKKQKGGKIDDSELICFVCNIIIYCVDEHTDSYEHKKNYFTYLEANKLNEIEVETFYCIPCNTIITIDYLMSHCTSRKHRLKLKNFAGNREGNTENLGNVQAGEKSSNNKIPPQVPSTSQIATSLSSKCLNDKRMRLKILYQFREMTDPTKLLCTVCDEEVTYSRKLAEHHVRTLDHVVAFNLMMLWNKIKKRDDKYFCDICRSDMTYFSEITHVLGKQHADNVAKEPKGTVYEYDRTLVTHAYAMSHKVGNRTRPSPVVSIAKPKDTMI